MWPFGKKKDVKSVNSAEASTKTEDLTGAGEQPTEGEQVGGAAQSDGAVAPQTASRPGPGSQDADYDPVNGNFGPFDGDSVDYRVFDFSDFAKGGLDLGSMLVPVPHAGEVQVEMGQAGPRQIHILTPHGRLTPAAFAAPRSGGQWLGDIDEFAGGMEKDGLEVTRRTNDWGEELIGTIGDGVVRVIGVDGPRWMLRMTLAGPATSAEALAELAYEVVSRTFVNRGDEPAPAGASLPVIIPQAMAEELKKAMEQQAAQQAAQQAGQQAPGPDSSGTPNAPDGTQVPPRRRSGGTVDQRMGDAE